MKSALLTTQQAAESIAQGKRLLLAGDGNLLAKLPSGVWIGGTSSYFMTSQANICSHEHVFAIELPNEVGVVSIAELDVASLPDIYSFMPKNGFGIVIMPAGSAVHADFAMNAPYYNGFASSPLIGWVSCTHVGEAGKTAPEVYSGKSRAAITDRAVVLYAELPANFYSSIEILNLFEPADGDRITFDLAGFSADTARVNGREQPFGAYIAEKGLDIRLPLVADYSGSMINISIQNVDPVTGRVSFYAPVFPGICYRQAKPVCNQVTAFQARMPQIRLGNMAFACNCYLNYVYSELEGKNTNGIAGPITFGEIAYQLLNQTMVYLSISSV